MRYSVSQCMSDDQSIGCNAATATELAFWRRFRVLWMVWLALPFMLAQHALAQVQLPGAASGSSGFAAVVAQVAPGVVGISVSQSRSADNPLLNDPVFRRFFEDLQGERGHGDSASHTDRPVMRPAGSGVVVDAARGLVLTNHHVVQGASRLMVMLNDRRELLAELVGSDPGTDVAVLRVRPEKLTAVPVGDSDALRVGDLVVAIGNPFGLGQTVTSGIVSAMGRGLSPEGYEDYIQTDAAVNPGNSGGALINMRGELVGINTAILSGGRGGQGGNIGIGFAIPTSMAQAVLDQIIRFGEVMRGRIGVQAEEVTEAVVAREGLPIIAGALVRSVASGSSADRAGLRVNDVVLEVDGRPVRTVSDLRNRVALIPVGNQIRLKVWRRGVQSVLQVPVEAVSADEVAKAQQQTPASSAPGVAKPSAPESTSVLQGMQLSRGRDGLLVSGVRAGAPAHALGFRNGDVILGVDRAPVSTVQEFGAVLRRSGSKVISVLRGEVKLRLHVG